jgi:hypothetical protein
MLLVLALGGCHDAAEPPPFAGTFALSTVFTASPLPVVLYQQSTRTTVLNRTEILADTLVVDANGTWQERTTYRYTENPESAPAVSYLSATGTGTWAIDSLGLLKFTLDAGQGAMLYNLGMKEATLVDATANELSFHDVIQFNLDWKPHFARVP